MQALGVCNGQGRSADVLREQPAQVPARYAEAIREMLDVAVIEHAVGNQTQAAPHGGRSAVPCGCARRTFRAASQARTVAGLAGGSGARKKADVFAFRRVRRADRAAVNARGPDADVELAIKPRVPGKSGAFVDVVLQHAPIS